MWNRSALANTAEAKQQRVLLTQDPFLFLVLPATNRITEEPEDNHQDQNELAKERKLRD